MAEEREQLDPKRLRDSLLKLASVIVKLDERGQLLESTPKLLKLMGDLRRQLFDYEVRSTGRLLPKEKLPPEVLEAQRIVKEAARRLEEDKEEGGQDT